ncbi:MAG: hypothetical protein F6K00_02315 [Leptolyngbya sp. SIOISBB]|nr:hypothetical protein [Leptolyngbya sp. SIOISBB]
MMHPDEVNKRFPRGKKVCGIVCQHRHFGLFVEIPGTDILGLVDTTGYKSTDSYPEIGSEIEVTILQFRDSENPLKRHFRLGVNSAIFSTDI